MLLRTSAGFLRFAFDLRWIDRGLFYDRPQRFLSVADCNNDRPAAKRVFRFEWLRFECFGKNAAPVYASHEYHYSLNGSESLVVALDGVSFHTIQSVIYVHSIIVRAFRESEKPYRIGNISIIPFFPLLPQYPGYWRKHKAF